MATDVEVEVDLTMLGEARVEASVEAPAGMLLPHAAFPSGVDRNKYLERMTHLFKTELDRQVQHYEAAYDETKEKLEQEVANNAALQERLNRNQEKQDHDRILHFKQVLTLKDQLMRINNSSPCMKELHAVATNMKGILSSGAASLRSVRSERVETRRRRAPATRLFVEEPRSLLQSRRRKARRITDPGKVNGAQLQLDKLKLKSDSLEASIERGQSKISQLEREVARLRCFESDAAAKRNARREILADDELALEEISRIVDAHVERESLRKKLYEMVKPEQSMSSEALAELMDAAAQRDDAMKLLEDSYEDQAKLMRQLEETKLKMEEIKEDRNEMSERCESLSAQLQKTMAKAVANLHHADELKDTLKRREEEAEAERLAAEAKRTATEQERSDKEGVGVAMMIAPLRVYSFDVASQTTSPLVHYTSRASQVELRSVPCNLFEQACMSTEDIHVTAFHLNADLTRASRECSLRTHEVEEMWRQSESLMKEKTAVERSAKLLSIDKADLEQRLEMMEEEVKRLQTKLEDQERNRTIQHKVKPKQRMKRRASACAFSSALNGSSSAPEGRRAYALQAAKQIQDTAQFRRLTVTNSPKSHTQASPPPNSLERKRLRQQVDVLRKELVATLQMVKGVAESKRVMRLLAEITNTDTGTVTPSILGRAVHLSTQVNRSHSQERHAPVYSLFQATARILQAIAVPGAEYTSTSAVTCGSFPTKTSQYVPLTRSVQTILSQLYVTLAARQESRRNLVQATWQRLRAKLHLHEISLRRVFVQRELEAHSRERWIRVLVHCEATVKESYGTLAKQEHTCRGISQHLDLLVLQITAKIAVDSNQCELRSDQPAMTTYIDPLDYVESFNSTMSQQDGYISAILQPRSPAAPPPASRPTPRLRYLLSTRDEVPQQGHQRTHFHDIPGPQCVSLSIPRPDP